MDNNGCCYTDCRRVATIECPRCHVLKFCSIEHQDACWNSSSGLHAAICQEPRGYFTIVAATGSVRGRLSNVCVPRSQINVLFIDKSTYDVRCGGCQQGVASSNPPPELDIDLGGGDPVLGAILFDRVLGSVIEAAKRDTRVYHAQCALKRLYTTQAQGTTINRLTPFLMAGGRVPLPLLKALATPGVILVATTKSSPQSPQLGDMPALLQFENQVMFSAHVQLFGGEDFVVGQVRAPMTFRWRGDCVFRTADILLEAAHVMFDDVTESVSSVLDKQNADLGGVVAQFFIGEAITKASVKVTLDEMCPTRETLGSLLIEPEALRSIIADVCIHDLQRPIASRTLTLVGDSDELSIGIRVRVVAQRSGHKIEHCIQILDVLGGLRPRAALGYVRPSAAH